MIQLGELIMILDLHRQGLGVSAIARRVGIDRKAVRKYIAHGLEPPTYGPRKPRPRQLDVLALQLAVNRWPIGFGQRSMPRLLAECSEQLTFQGRVGQLGREQPAQSGRGEPLQRQPHRRRRYPTRRAISLPETPAAFNRSTSRTSRIAILSAGIAGGFLRNRYDWARRSRHVRGTATKPTCASTTRNLGSLLSRRARLLTTCRLCVGRRRQSRRLLPASRAVHDGMPLVSATGRPSLRIPDEVGHRFRNEVGH